MSKKLARNEGARPAPEPRAGPGAGADLKDVADRRAMARLLRERPPEEVLVECERAGVRIAALEVDVRPLQIRRRQYNPFEHCRLEVHNVPREPGLDPVRVVLAQRFRPRAATGVELV